MAARAALPAAYDKFRFAMAFRTSAISLVALLGYSSALCAQRAKTPTLDEILHRLQANLNRYDARVPSLFCDEHVVSSQTERNIPDESTVTDSVFRLKRTPGADDSTILAESREIKTVNGKPATSQDMNAPTTLSGAFEGGLAVVSLDQTACMSYALQPINRRRPAEPYIVRFATALTPQNSAGCLLQEKSKGRAFIDPASLQITHLELTTPRHVMIPGDSFSSPVVGRRVLSVDYAPVLLGGETFWMPARITMRITRGSGTYHETVWSFEATYRNYHKLEVTARIVPGSEVPVQ
jgi:hypothetical protein